MGCGACKPSVLPEGPNGPKQQGPKAPKQQGVAPRRRPEAANTGSRGSSGLGQSLPCSPARTTTALSDDITRHDRDVTGKRPDITRGSDDADSLFGSRSDCSNSNSGSPVKSKWTVSTHHGAQGNGPSANDTHKQYTCNHSPERQTSTATPRKCRIFSSDSKYTVGSAFEDDYEDELEFLLSKSQLTHHQHHQSKDSVYHSQEDNISYSSMSSIFSSPSVASGLSDSDSLIEEDRSPSVNSLYNHPVCETRSSSRSHHPRQARPNAASVHRRRRAMETCAVSWSSSMTLSQSLAGGMPPAVS